MAKKWKPSQKQLSIYDELLKRQNEVRKQVLRRRKIIEGEGTGRTLPDLIVPMKARRSRDLNYSFNSYEDFRKKLKALKDLYGMNDDATEHFYREKYKNNILGILKDWLGVNPTGKFGKYEEGDMLNNPELERYMLVYNDLVSLDIGTLMAMYDSGMIPSLRYIYQDMQGKTSFSEIDYFISNFKDLRRQARNQRNIMVKDLSTRSNRVKSEFNKAHRKYKV